MKAQSKLRPIILYCHYWLRGKSRKHKLVMYIKYPGRATFKDSNNNFIFFSSFNKTKDGYNS